MLTIKYKTGNETTCIMLGVPPPPPVHSCGRVLAINNIELGGGPLLTSESLFRVPRFSPSAFDYHPA